MSTFLAKGEKLSLLSLLAFGLIMGLTDVSSQRGTTVDLGPIASAFCGLCPDGQCRMCPVVI